MKTVEVKIRLPEDIHAQLKELAAKEGRSMNKQTQPQKPLCL